MNEPLLHAHVHVLPKLVDLSMPFRPMLHGYKISFKLLRNSGCKQSELCVCLEYSGFLTRL